MTNPEIPLEQLKLLRDQLKAELSLYEFIKQSWTVINGEKVPYADGWHIQAVCEHLEAVANRQIKRLIINIPPRCGKTTMVSIAFPAWVWINNPHEKFLYASYAQSLSDEHSQNCRRLIISSWYQERWGDRYRLMDDQNTKRRFENNKKGYRIATSVGAAGTGLGGNFLILDDPNNIKDVYSETIREGILRWNSQTLATRLNDKKNDVRIIIQQRSHERDVSGYEIAHDDEGEWVKLILPMEFELERKCSTVILPGNNDIWADPREDEKELLWPLGIPAKSLKQLKAELASDYAISGQLQQRPSPAAGGIIKKDWFRWWKHVSMPDIDFVVQSWDTAYSMKKKSSYSACTTWGVFLDHNYVENLILLSAWRGRVEYPQLREMAKRLYYDYRDTGTERNTHLKGRSVDLCLIEGKASGDSLIQDLYAAGLNVIAFNPTVHGDKTRRASISTPLIEGGRVWMPAKPPHYDVLFSYADMFVEAAVAFPTLESNDLVDTMSQVLLKLREGRFLTVPGDYEGKYSYSPRREVEY